MVPRRGLSARQEGTFYGASSAGTRPRELGAVRATIPAEPEGQESACNGCPEQRERLVAHIVRDFMNAYALARRIGVELRAGTLDFATVDRFVGDSPRSVLFRLKEDCHSLFRDPGSSRTGEPQATELFDLAVGALFHEAMKFRESYYLYTAYGPRARRSLEESTAGPLSQGFRRLFDAGYRRMLESEAETEELFRETRQQLRVLLREWRDAGEIARSLLADAEHTEAVFATPLGELLEELYGSVSRGHALAIRCLVWSGHYAEAAALADCPGLVESDLEGVDPDLVRGLAAYYEGNPCRALRLLREWADRGADGAPPLRARARAVLRLISCEVEERSPALVEQARNLEERLTQAESARDPELPE
jgi:hypothetical protein